MYRGSYFFYCLYLLTRGASDPNETWLTSLSAGVAFAASICLWFLYVLATPTLLIWPFILAVSPNKSRFRFGLQTLCCRRNNNDFCLRCCISSPTSASMGRRSDLGLGILSWCGQH